MVSLLDMLDVQDVSQPVLDQLPVLADVERPGIWTGALVVGMAGCCLTSVSFVVPIGSLGRARMD